MTNEPNPTATRTLAMLIDALPTIAHDHDALEANCNDLTSIIIIFSEEGMITDDEAMMIFTRIDRLRTHIAATDEMINHLDHLRDALRDNFEIPA